MPAHLRVIVSRACRRIDFIPAVHGLTTPALIPFMDKIILHTHYQCIFPCLYIFCYVQLKGRKEPFMASRQSSVHKHIRNIIHTSEQKIDSLIAVSPRRKSGPVISDRISQRAAVVGDCNLLPFSASLQHARKIGPVRLCLLPPVKLLQFLSLLQCLKSRSQFSHKRAVLLLLPFQLPVQFLPGMHFRGECIGCFCGFQSPDLFCEHLRFWCLQPLSLCADAACRNIGKFIIPHLGYHLLLLLPLS